MGTNPAVYGWILKGKTRELRPNIAGQGVEINGNVSFNDQSIVSGEDERINAESTRT